MKEHYFFGYLYIKSSRFLALISIILGVLVCGTLLLDWNKTLDQARYKPNPLLVNNLTKLQEVYKDTRENTFKFITQQGETVDSVKLLPDPKIYTSYTLPEHFAELQEQVNVIQKNSDTLKDLTYKNFAKSADFLLKKMLTHAETKGWLPKKENVANKENESEIPLPFRLLSVENNADLNDKRDGLNEAIDFANALLADAENSDSQENLTKMSNYLNGYLSILNAAGMTLITKAGEAEEDAKMKNRVFQMISKLNLMKESVRAVIYNNWTLDNEYEKTSSLIQAELKNCLNSQESVRKIVSDYAFKLAFTLLISIGVTISILLCADFLKAILLMSLKK